jgi:hypothetical protein
MNKYHRWHDAIIERARAREAQGMKVEGDRHHVVPKSLGGSDDRSNIVKLTYREHFLIHWLLTKITEGLDRAKMYYALGMMMNGGANRKSRYSSWQYDLARRAYSKAASTPGSRKNAGPALRLRLSTPEVKLKKSESARRAQACPKYREKSALRSKRHWSDPKRRAERSAKIKQVMNDPDVRQKKSETTKKLWSDPDFRQKVITGIQTTRANPELNSRYLEANMRTSDIMKERWTDPEYRVRAAKSRNWTDPEYRERASAAMKAGWARRNVRLAAEG